MKTKPITITITGSDDQERTASFRAALLALGYDPNPYQWHCGQPLYCGEVTQDWFECKQITIVVIPPR